MNKERSRTSGRSQANALPSKVQVEELTTILRLSRTAFDIWWHFSNKEFVDKNRELINNFSQYFFFNTEANFCACVVRICVLFDKGRTTQDLESVGKLLLKEGALSRQKFKVFQQILLRVRPTAEKVQLLRHNIMAHKSRFEPFAEVYRRAGITPNDLRKLTDGSLEAVNVLRSAKKLDPTHFEHDYLTEDLVALTDALRSETS